MNIWCDFTFIITENDKESISYSYQDAVNAIFSDHLSEIFYSNIPELHIITEIKKYLCDNMDDFVYIYGNEYVNVVSENFVDEIGTVNAIDTFWKKFDKVLLQELLNVFIDKVTFYSRDTWNDTDFDETFDEYVKDIKGLDGKDSKVLYCDNDNICILDYWGPIKDLPHLAE
ncbi:MAG: hypothetical protein VZS44_10135 [Bacilli bacterium]|nr:hypothetical protein [Bacilli bacterium]